MDQSSDRRIFEFICYECGSTHRGSPSFSYHRPPLYYDVPEDDRASRITDSDDGCIILPAAASSSIEPLLFIRTVLEVPICGFDEPFTWGVWVSQSEDSYNCYAETMGTDQSGMSSFGWLAVTMPYYDSIDSPFFTNLACNVRWQAMGRRPKLELHDGDHELISDQRNGIGFDKASKIATLVMHAD